MAGLEAPWAGLLQHASRVDIHAVLVTLAKSPGAAGAEDWTAAGLPMDAAHDAITVASVPGDWIHVGHPDWPRLLEGLPFGPVALQVEGDVTRLAAPTVALVGARRCTAWGKGWARRIAEAVAASGGVVVSGMAWGIDAEAHEAAGGATVAVLGQGLSAPMAAWATRLRASIVKQGGLVVSEFPALMPASKITFPIRNRVVAGLSRAVVVVEAAKRSGSRITAGLGRDYGREVLALPGPPEAEVSEGCLDLIEEGVTMVRSPRTVLAALGLDRPAVSPRTREGRLLAVLGGGATPEEIAERTGLDLRALQELLGELELRGLVRRAPGRRYLAVG